MTLLESVFGGRHYTRRRGYEAATYVVTVGDDEVCRYTWTIHGATVASAALDVAFRVDTPAVFDRAFAMALAPLLEQKARLASEWHA